MLSFTEVLNSEILPTNGQAISSIIQILMASNQQANHIQSKHTF